MSNFRAIIRLLLAIAALAVADFLVFFRYDGAGRQLSERRTLLSVTPDSVGGIGITGEDGEAFSIVRGDGREWSFRPPPPVAGEADAVDAPVASAASRAVDGRAVMKFLDALTFTEIDDVMTDGDLLRHGCVRSDYHLDPARMVFEIKGGGAVERVRIGSVTPSGSGVYASVDGRNEVYVMPSNLLVSVAVKADDFRRREVFDVGVDEVISVEIRSEFKKPVLVMRDGASSFAGDFIKDVVSVAAIEFVWPQRADEATGEASAALISSYGLDRDSALTLTLKCTGRADRQLILGKSAGEGRVYALIDAVSVVTVDSSLVGRSLNAMSELSDSRLFRLNSADVTSFTVAEGGVSYVLAREDAMSWRLDSPVSAPADVNVVKALLDRILAVSAADVVADGLTVTVSSNLPSVVVSEKALLGGSRLDDLRSREIIGFDRELVRRIVSTGADGSSESVVFNRELKSWNVEAESSLVNVNVSAVAAVLDAICPLTAVRVERIKAAPDELEAFGLEHPALVLAVDSYAEGAVRKNIIVGSGERGLRYLTIGSSDAIFTIPEAVFKTLSGRLTER